MPVLDRIEMDGDHVNGIFLVATYRVFSIPALPNIGLALANHLCAVSPTIRLPAALRAKPARVKSSVHGATDRNRATRLAVETWGLSQGDLDDYASICACW